MKNLRLFSFLAMLGLFSMPLLNAKPSTETTSHKSTEASRKKSASTKAYKEITTEKQFTDALSKSGVYVIKFGAPWCSFCVKMEPDFESTARKLSGTATFLSINTDNLKEISKIFNITGLPTTIVLTKKTGALSQEELSQMVHNAKGQAHSVAQAPAEPRPEKAAKMGNSASKKIKASGSAKEIILS